MNFNLSTTITLAVTISGLTLSALPASTDAAWSRNNASICHPAYSDTPNDIYNGGWIQNTGNIPYVIYCPVYSDNNLPHNAVTMLNIHGINYAGSRNRSRACVKHYNNIGAACGAFKDWTQEEYGVLNVDLTQWHIYGASFPYLYNDINPGSKLYGFFIAN
jgi:hypothetical protein